MSDKDLARRTEIKLKINGVDITDDINQYFISLSYTDNEEDKADDLQITLDDREGVWIGKWINSHTDKTAGKCAEISAVIMQKNFEGDGKDRILDCGVFEIDSIDSGGPPATVNLKGTSIPYTSTIRTQKKTKAWENIKLSKIAKEIAVKNGMQHFFESNYDPIYQRKEQVRESDIVFLQSCESLSRELIV